MKCDNLESARDGSLLPMGLAPGGRPRVVMSDNARVVSHRAPSLSHYIHIQSCLGAIKGGVVEEVLRIEGIGNEQVPGRHNRQEPGLQDGAHQPRAYGQRHAPHGSHTCVFVNTPSDLRGRRGRARQEPGQHDGILQGTAAPLPKVGCHWMQGIPSQGNTLCRVTAATENKAIDVPAVGEPVPRRSPGRGPLDGIKDARRGPVTAALHQDPSRLV